MSTKTDTATGLAATAAAGKTFDTVLADLAQPFDPEAVEFKAGATTQDKARALALAYVDSRVYQGRLDAVTPDWRNEYTREYAGERVIVTCALTVAGVTRQAIGESLQASARHDGSTVIEENAATSAEAQAFKRPARPSGWAATSTRSRRCGPSTTAASGSSRRRRCRRCARCCAPASTIRRRAATVATVTATMAALQAQATATLLQLRQATRRTALRRLARSAAASCGITAPARRTRRRPTSSAATRTATASSGRPSRPRAFPSNARAGACPHDAQAISQAYRWGEHIRSPHFLLLRHGDHAWTSPHST